MMSAHLCREGGMRNEEWGCAVPNAPQHPPLDLQVRSVQQRPAPVCQPCTQPCTQALLCPPAGSPPDRAPAPRALPHPFASHTVSFRHQLQRRVVPQRAANPPAETPSDRFPSKASALYKQAPTGDCAQKTHSPWLFVYSNSDGNSNAGKPLG